jgi:hypothetical protein
MPPDTPSTGVGAPTPLTRERQETVGARLADRRHPRVIPGVFVQGRAID